MLYGQMEYANSMIKQILSVFQQYLNQQINPEGIESANQKYNKKMALLNQLQLMSKKANDFVGNDFALNAYDNGNVQSTLP